MARLAGTDLRSLLPLKFLIFVVDIGQAARYADEVPASIEQAQQSIRQALGVKQMSDKKRLETIFAGYDGMIRSPLESDNQFKLFMDSLPEAPAKKVTNELDLVRRQMQTIIDEHKEAHRLTKEELARAKAIIIDKDGMIHKLQEEMEEAVHRAAINLQEERDKRRIEVTKLRDEHAASLLEVSRQRDAELQQLRNELEGEMARREGEWKRMLESSKAATEAVKNELRDAERRLERFDEEISAIKSTFNDQLEQKDQEIAQIQQEKEEIQDKVDGLNKEINGLGKKLEKARLDASRATRAQKAAMKQVEEWKEKYESLLNKDKKDEGGDDSKKKKKKKKGVEKFEWQINDISEKWNYEPGRSVQSPAFSIGSIHDMVLEFFPAGIRPPRIGESTAPTDFVDVKIRVPDDTTICWKMTIGDQLFGPQTDHFNKRDWHYRMGITRERIFRIPALQQFVDADDNLTLVFEVLDDPPPSIPPTLTSVFTSDIRRAASPPGKLLPLFEVEKDVGSKVIGSPSQCGKSSALKLLNNSRPHTTQGLVRGSNNIPRRNMAAALGLAPVNTNLNPACGYSKKALSRPATTISGNRSQSPLSPKGIAALGGTARPMTTSFGTRPNTGLME